MVDLTVNVRKYKYNFNCPFCDVKSGNHNFVCPDALHTKKSIRPINLEILGSETYVHLLSSVEKFPLKYEKYREIVL